MFYDNFNSNSEIHSRSAAEITIRAHQQEKQMALMNALLHKDTSNNSDKPAKKSKNIFKSLLGIFLAGF
jgi:hypothetical protein